MGLPQRQLYFSAIRREFAGISENVHQDSVQLVSVTHYTAVFHITEDREADVLFFHLPADQVSGCPHGVFNVDRFRLQFHLSALDAAHLQHIVDNGQQLMSRDVDFVQILADLFLSAAFLSGQGRVTQNGVERSTDVVRHVGQEEGLRPAGIFRRTQTRFQLFVLLDSVCNPPDQQLHHHDEDASAEQDRRHNKIRLPEEADSEIPAQEQYQQQNRKPQDALFLLPVAPLPDMSCKTDILPDIADHQGAAQIDHAINQQISDCFAPPFFLLFADDL